MSNTAAYAAYAAAYVDRAANVDAYAAAAHAAEATHHYSVPTPQTDSYRYLAECNCGWVDGFYRREDIPVGMRAHFGIYRDRPGHVIGR